MKTFSRLMMILGFSLRSPPRRLRRRTSRPRRNATAQILELKKAGTVGETSDGYVAVREGDDEKASKLVDEETRRPQSHLRKDRQGHEVSVESVAERAAKRAFEKRKAANTSRTRMGSGRKRADCCDAHAVAFDSRSAHHKMSRFSPSDHS
jgi:uncharacterized protein YdbL (DUF1318 family)